MTEVCFEKTRECLKRKLSSYSSLKEIRTKPPLISIEQLRKTQEILKTKLLPRRPCQSSVQQISLSNPSVNHNTLVPLTPKPSPLKPKPSLTFHQYKGPLEKVEKTKCLATSIEAPLKYSHRIEYCRPASLKIEGQQCVTPSSSITNYLTDKELYQTQERKLIELEKQLEKFKQNDSSTKNPIMATSKCHPIRAVQLHKKILIQEQEKLREKLQLNILQTTDDIFSNEFNEDLDCDLEYIQSLTQFDSYSPTFSLEFFL